MMAEAAYRVFISYSRKDSEFVDRLQAVLETRNFKAWVDRRNLEGTEEFPQEIEKAIAGCEALIVVLSPDATQAQWVRRELNYAMQLKRPIVPLMFRSVPLPVEISNINFLDFQGDFEKGMQALQLAFTKVPHMPELNLPEPPPYSTPGSIVDPPQPLPPPDPNLNNLLNAAYDAIAQQDYERGVVYLQQIVDTDPSFGNGTAKKLLADTLTTLYPLRVQRFRERGLAAAKAARWHEAIGAWDALLGLKANDLQAFIGIRASLDALTLQEISKGNWEGEIGALEALLRLEPYAAKAQDALTIAQHNRQYAFIYANAQNLYKSGNIPAAKSALESLWGQAPNYGDPAKLAPLVNIQAPLRQDQKEAQVLAQGRQHELSVIAHHRPRPGLFSSRPENLVLTGKNGSATWQSLPAMPETKRGPSVPSSITFRYSDRINEAWVLNGNKTLWSDKYYYKYGSIDPVAFGELVGVGLGRYSFSTETEKIIFLDPNKERQQPVATFEGYKDYSRSPDKQRVMIVRDKSAEVRSATNVQQTICTMNGEYTQATWSTKGNFIVTSSATSPKWQLWSSQTGQLFALPLSKEQDQLVDFYAWSPDETLIAVALPQQIIIYNIFTSEAVYNFHPKLPSLQSLRWSPYGMMIACYGTGDNFEGWALPSSLYA